MSGIFINIPDGTLTTKERREIICTICKDENIVEDMENFWDLVKEKLPSLHFTVDSEVGGNLNFLNFITQWFNRDERVKNTLDDTTRLLETSTFGNFILVNDSGFIQFRCPSFIGLQELYKFYVIFDEEKHLKEE